MKRILLSLITILLIPIAVSFAQEKGQRFIEVTGQSEKSVAPNRVEVTVTLRANENAKKENELQEKQTEIVSIAKQFNISNEDLIIDRIAGNRSGYFKIASNRYQFSKVLRMQVRNLSTLDDLMIRLLEAGANDVSITQMKSDSLEKVRTLAIQEATLNARKRAMDIAKSLNVELGKAIEVIELNLYQPREPVIRSRYEMLSASGAVHRAYDPEIVYSADQELNVGKIRLAYNVLVRFEIQ